MGDFDTKRANDRFDAGAEVGRTWLRTKAPEHLGPERFIDLEQSMRVDNKPETVRELDGMPLDAQLAHGYAALTGEWDYAPREVVEAFWQKVLGTDDLGDLDEDFVHGFLHGVTDAMDDE
jgi:hypothetical protein